MRKKPRQNDRKYRQHQFPYAWEHECIKQLGISPQFFHKVHSSKWKHIYDQITETFVDKTKTWRNGLHWANTNGYAPKCTRLGAYQTDTEKWFLHLPQIIGDTECNVYFLLDNGGAYEQSKFWIFEVRVKELIQILDLCYETVFLDVGLGWPDYYIVSKKYEWLIGYNHHDIVSFVGEGICLDCFAKGMVK